MHSGSSSFPLSPRSERSTLVNARAPAHIVLILTAPLVGAVQETQVLSNPVNVHRSCELTAAWACNVTSAAPSAVAGTVTKKTKKKRRPLRFADGFALVQFTRKQTERQITTVGLGSMNGALFSTSILGCLSNDVL